MTNSNLLGFPRPRNTLQASPTLQNGQAIIVPTVPINQPKVGKTPTSPATTALGKGIAKTATNTSVTPAAKVKAVNKPLPPPPVTAPTEAPIISPPPTTDGQ
jgi:hypothetical protein